MYSSKLCISNLDLTRVLLNFGPSTGIGEKDMEEGNTPLHWAIVGGVMSPYSLSPLLKVIWVDSTGGFVQVGEKSSACNHRPSHVLLDLGVGCGVATKRWMGTQFPVVCHHRLVCYFLPVVSFRVRVAEYPWPIILIAAFVVGGC